MDAADRGHLERTFELAERGRRTVGRNPVVGAVIVRDGRVIGEGWHERPGRPHAEVAALAAATEDVHGATMYVSLEPCSHHGRTPPCADALIAAGIGRVVAAMTDPTPRVQGRGFARLRSAGVGVEVATGELERRARRMVAEWLTLELRGRPHVTYKAAVSADGRTAAAPGRQTWISSPASRALVHEWRAAAGAVAVGIGTVLADDPLLTARDCDPPAERQPLRVVFDRHGRLPPDSQLARSAASDQPVEVFAGDLAEALDELGRRGIAAFLLEGGATIATAFLDAGLIDRVAIFRSPQLLGGDGPGLFTRELTLPEPWTSRRVGVDMLTISELNQE
jgi:diaminohydroxyphosphoribosylaminopyrimidine deaminase / 5-amino-6-(5-phosphoribosylamino)uracil reductase